MAEYIDMTKRATYIGCVFDALLGLDWAIQEAVDFCDKLENADVVEVVLCKDCKHRGNPMACPMCYEDFYIDDDGDDCGGTVDLTVEDGFCHGGEREE